MVNYLLKITADLENLTNLQPSGGCDDPNFPYLFKLKCERCGEVTQKETCVTLNETFTPPGGRGTCHLVQKCKFCGREGNVTMIPGKGRPLTLEDSEAGEHAPLMVFDCRGYEPIDFGFGGFWKAEAESGTKFDEIDLSSGEEFTEYDEKGECPLKCERCGEVTQKETCVTLNETFTPPGGRGTCHLVQKCKFCGREGNVTMIPGKGRPLTLEDSEAGEHAPLMVFDCRGYEPIDFGFGGFWKAEAESGTKFDEIDLSSGEEFTEYDEKGECPLKCERCGEVTQKETCVTLNETFTPPGGRGTCHLVQKCKFCGREGNVTMIPGKGRPLTLEDSEAGEHAPLMVFDCRGYEPIDFGFGGFWKAEAESGTKFDEIDLSSGEEFTEYDEKGECPVMISNFRASFTVTK